MSACFVEASGLTFQNGDGVVKVSRGSAVPRSIDCSPHIWESSMDRINGSTVDQQSKQLKARPGNKLDVL
jgi:hypothetical protein